MFRVEQRKRYPGRKLRRTKRKLRKVGGKLGECGITDSRGGENVKKEGVFSHVKCYYRDNKKNKDLKINRYHN